MPAELWDQPTLLMEITGRAGSIAASFILFTSHVLLAKKILINPI